ncbi:glycosyltransferase family 1 protein [Leptospira sp. 96542]|nr:glycosyltransferase family 1 protein [Leptospira sp. 96542]
MPIKIGYDARMIENSGIGIRIQHILKFWPIPKEKATLYIFGNPKVLNQYQIPNHAEIIHYDANIYSINELLGHPRMKEMDVLDIPHFNVPIALLKKCIVTIHDLIPYHFKTAHSSIAKRIYLHLILRLIRLFAKKIITVSEFTKQDLVNHFQFPEDKITVIYNGVDLKTFRKNKPTYLASFLKKYNLPKQYLFTVGIGKAHKNFPFLLSCLDSMWKEGTLKLPLVIGGISKEIPSDLLAFQEKRNDKIYFLPHLPYDTLPLAYGAAKVFIYPSLYEGFGFPVIEAQSTETTVFSSNASVLPEILGNSAEYFDPHSEEDFKSKLAGLLKKPPRQNQLVKLGKANTKRFLWENAIQNLAKFYEREIF